MRAIVSYLLDNRVKDIAGFPMHSAPVLTREVRAERFEWHVLWIQYLETCLRVDAIVRSNLEIRLPLRRDNVNNGVSLPPAELAIASDRCVQDCQQNQPEFSH